MTTASGISTLPWRIITFCQKKLFSTVHFITIQQEVNRSALKIIYLSTQERLTEQRDMNGY